MESVMTAYSQKTVGDLLKIADTSPGIEDSVHALRVAEIKNSIRANELNEKLLDCNDRACQIAARQLAASESANTLSTELLKSNQHSSEIAEKNASALNGATKELAKSTSGLNRATWILAIFTGIQVVLAIVNIYLTIHSKCP
jgi:hypothetical protein